MLFVAPICLIMKKNSNELIALILTHGRPDRVHTYESLRKHGYTGPIRVVIDDEDKTAEEYHRKFPGEVIVFDKTKWALATDAMDNFPHRKAIVYARNAAYEIAEQLGYRWFLQFDDDYVSWDYRHNGLLEYVVAPIRSLDLVFGAMLQYAQKGPTLALAQEGDFIGGGGGNVKKSYWGKRKTMNSWLCDTRAPIQFSGHMNEDCTAYVIGGLRGRVFLQTFSASLSQKATQANAGGMTDAYLESGTYQKTFYTIMAAPSCTRIRTVTPNSGRIHHSIKWNNCAPKILNEKWRKAA